MLFLVYSISSKCTDYGPSGASKWIPWDPVQNKQWFNFAHWLVEMLLDTENSYCRLYSVYGFMTKTRSRRTKKTTLEIIQMLPNAVCEGLNNHSMSMQGLMHQDTFVSSRQRGPRGGYCGKGVLQYVTLWIYFFTNH